LKIKALMGEIDKLRKWREHKSWVNLKRLESECEWLRKDTERRSLELTLHELNSIDGLIDDKMCDLIPIMR